GRRLGLVDDARWAFYVRKCEAIEQEQNRLDSIRIFPGVIDEERLIQVLGKTIEREYTLTELLRRPDVSYADLMVLCGAEQNAGNAWIDAQIAEQVEIQ